MTDYLHINGHQITMEGKDLYLIVLDVGTFPGSEILITESDHLILHNCLDKDGLKDDLNKKNYVSLSQQEWKIMTIQEYIDEYPERNGHTNYIGPCKNVKLNEGDDERNSHINHEIDDKYDEVKNQEDKNEKINQAIMN